LYSRRPSVTIGFHGCDAAKCRSLLNGDLPIIIALNPYDWLGSGMYFWEHSEKRAQEWAAEGLTRGKVENPAVIGAVIDLGNCLDFLDSKYLALLRPSYERLNLISEVGMPQNRRVAGSPDYLLRNLDCAVIESIHKDREDQRDEPFDSVRGVFWEGTEPYPAAGFKDKNHIQLCVRNPNCIKGYFLPRTVDTNWNIP
jgi:hypothetical protein